MTFRDAAKWLKGDAKVNLFVTWFDGDGDPWHAYVSQKARTIGEWYMDVRKVVNGADDLIGFHSLEWDIEDDCVLCITDRTIDGSIYKKVYEGVI